MTTIKPTSSALLAYLGINEAQNKGILTVSESSVVIIGCIDDVEITGPDGHLSWNTGADLGANVDGDNAIEFTATVPYPPIEPPEPTIVQTALDDVLDPYGDDYATVMGWRFVCGPFGTNDAYDPPDGNQNAWLGGVNFSCSMVFATGSFYQDIHIRCKTWSSPITLYIANAAQVGNAVIIQPYRKGDGGIFTIHSPYMSAPGAPTGLLSTAALMTPFDLRNETHFLELQPLLLRTKTKERSYRARTPRVINPLLQSSLAM